ncbi:unnamed protein product [Schistosoma mattheei]|uniref:Uncharacterized protein n=1 Tax=Schistosoma mattheei TaxID=31246 RepID=A0A183NR78_9TREM|nr:unnamed protein product [Schistosoma mattheei]
MLSNPKDLQQAAASALFTGSSKRSLVLVTKCYGVVGVVRFLRGYYLILITKYSVVAQLGEHQICKVSTRFKRFLVFLFIQNESAGKMGLY